MFSLEEEKEKRVKNNNHFISKVSKDIPIPGRGGP
jgi:hypothetical protein